MALVKHPKVTKERIVVHVQMPTPGFKNVLVVETSMPIDFRDPHFDRDEFEALRKAVSDAMEKEGLDEARIESAQI